jgi:hypothetical protein
MGKVGRVIAGERSAGEKYQDRDRVGYLERGIGG